MRASLFACVTAGFVGVEGGFEKGRLGGKEGENAPTWWPKIVAPRQSVLLDGEWAYGFRASGDSLMADADSMPFNETMLVPACVDAADPGYYGNRGVSMYRTEFTTASDADYVLEFMACAFFCRVWVDGVEIEKGHVNGGYVPFQRRVPRKAGPRQLTVLADNRFNLTTAPMHTGGDFWHYGGLVRSVVLHALPVAAAPAVWRAYVTPKLDATLAERWTVDVDVVLADCAFGGNLGIDFAWAPDGEESLETTVVLAFFKGRAAHSHAVPAGAKTWSTTSSFLQTLSVWSAGGGVTERFGLRWWGSDAGRLTLNGEVLKLVGWNHHTQWPETAASPTEEQMDDDIALLVRGGANYVRGAHYPQDQRWLDRLDAAGLTMWEETLGPGVSVGQLNDEKWMAVQLAQLDAMQDASLNHASIMTWGFFNEGPSEKEESCGAYAACAARLQKRDSSRFVTWASNAEERDVCLDAATLVSFNGYPGWCVCVCGTIVPRHG